MLVGHPLSLLKFYVQIHLIQHGVDPLAASVDDDDIDPYLIKKSHVFDKFFLQSLVFHDAAAVFYDKRLSSKSFDIW